MYITKTGRPIELPAPKCQPNQLKNKCQANASTRQGQQSMALAAIALSLLLVAAAPAAGARSEEPAPVLQCHSTPALTDATDGAAFRATLLPLLGALPSAASRTGFASLRSDGASARGFCFGDFTTLPSGSECVRCLSDAARNLTAGCAATSRRAGILSERCSLSYADTNFSSPRQDALRARFHLALPASSDSATGAGVLYSAGLHDELVAMTRLLAQRAAARITRPPMPATTRVVHKTVVERGCGCDYAVVSSTVDVRAHCAGDLTAAGCARCVQSSAQAVGWDLDAGRGLGPRRCPRRRWRGGRAGGLQLPRSVRGVHGISAAPRPELPPQRPSCSPSSFELDTDSSRLLDSFSPVKRKRNSRWLTRLIRVSVSKMMRSGKRLQQSPRLIGAK